MTLTGFASLVQLWAAFCLLFFYESVIKQSPFLRVVDELRTLHNNFYKQYLAEIPEFRETSNCNIIDDCWVTDIMPTIRNIAAMSFFYAIILLVVIGVENVDEIGERAVCSLQGISIMMYLYLMGVTLFTKARIFHTYLTPIIITGLMVVYLHFSSQLNQYCIHLFGLAGDYWSHSTITVVSIFALFGGLAVVLLRIGMQWFLLKLQRRRLKTLNDRCAELFEYSFGFRQFDRLSPKLQNSIKNEIANNLQTDDIEISRRSLAPKIIRKEIAAEYNALIAHRSWLYLVVSAIARR